MGILLTQSNTFLIGGIAKILGLIMNGIFEVLSKIGIENIGWCIIIFTIIIYTLMLPMTIKQQKFTRMSAVMNPELQKIQKKYQNRKDQASMLKMQEETKLVYEKYGTSPTGGCMSSLIQFPILFALWPVVRNIPAYVNGVKNAYMPLVNEIMATKGYEKIMMKIGEARPILINSKVYSYKEANTIVDVLYKFQSSTWDTLTDKFPQLTDLIRSTEASIKPMNNFLGINMAETPSSMMSVAMKNFSIGLIIIALAIPVLAGLSQWISARLMQQSTNSGDDNPMASQMKTMMNVMPIMSVVMCYTMPAGLGIYWIVSAVVRTIQQLVINKHLDKIPMNELVKENVEKAAKKREKKDAVSGSAINTMAQKNTKKIEEPKQQKKVTSNNDVDSYKKDAKPGSLASKANMVSDFNKNNK